jgi:hypothetical protein
MLAHAEVIVRAPHYDRVGPTGAIGERERSRPAFQLKEGSIPPIRLQVGQGVLKETIGIEHR